MLALLNAGGRLLLLLQNVAAGRLVLQVLDQHMVWLWARTGRLCFPNLLDPELGSQLRSSSVGARNYCDAGWKGLTL